MRRITLGLLGLIFLPLTMTATGALAPDRLRCEYRDNPVGLSGDAPRLGWSFRTPATNENNLAQSGYRIMVASSQAALARATADRWDSGKVAGAQNQNIVYTGPALVSDADYWWKVQVWDQAGQASDWSAPAHWSTGVIHPQEWHAQWIGLDAEPHAGENPDQSAQRERVRTGDWAQAGIAASKTEPLRAYIRRGFTIAPDRTLDRASLFLVPDQVCRITVNGRELGVVTRWDRAQAFDLLGLLASGDNAIGLQIDQQDGLSPSVVGELELHFSNGELFRSPIGPSWHYAAEAVSGWDRANFSPPAGTAPWKALTSIGKSPWGTPEDATLQLPPAPFLRKDFAVARPLRRALLHITALGLYEVRLNGERVGQDYFTPGWTDYLRRVPAQTYDVTGLLHAGPNAIGALLGDGWYASSLAYTGRKQLYGGYPRLSVQLKLEYSDGSSAEVVSDGSWKAAVGPVLQADMLQGYTYDARKESAGWDRAGFNASGWKPVATGLRFVDAAEQRLGAGVQIEPARMDPVRISDRLSAQSIRPAGPGRYLVDFGQNLVGWVRLKVRGRAGQRILVRHGEMLNPNGTIYTSNLRGASAVDTYWLKGAQAEILEPKFTYHGFRYAEITGLEDAPQLADVEGVAAYSALERTGDFECSDPRVNRLYQNIIWGQKGNYFEAPTDCPQRDERMGWTGDTQFFIPTAAYNFNVASFIERWLTTISTDEQGPDGTYPVIAPDVGRKTWAATAWGDAAIICGHQLWKVYGDTRVIDRHFAEYVRYLDYLYVDSENGIVSVGGFGDWLNQGGGAKTEVMDTAYYAYLCGLMADMAQATGRVAEAHHFAARRKEVSAAFQRAFFSPDGAIQESSQTGYALAFTMNLVPEALRTAAGDKFVGEIASRDWHLATGFIGTPRLLPALHLAGHDEIAYRVLLQDTYPSWLFQVKNGATTMWERWDGWTPDSGFQTIGMNSFNHYAFGSVGEYLYRIVAGIDSDRPGFGHIIYQPTPGTGLTWARGSFDSPNGRIESAWKIAAGRLTVDAVIPPNSTATVRLPGQIDREVGSGVYHWDIAWP